MSIESALDRLPREIYPENKGKHTLFIWRRNDGLWFVWYGVGLKVEEEYLHREITSMNLEVSLNRMYQWLDERGYILFVKRTNKYQMIGR